MKYKNLRNLLLEDWSERSERDDLFPWVVRYSYPGETDQALKLLPSGMRERFLSWLAEFSPDSELIDRFGIFERPDDLAKNYQALRKEQLGERAEALPRGEAGGSLGSSGETDIYVFTGPLNPELPNVAFRPR